MAGKLLSERSARSVRDPWIFSVQRSIPIQQTLRKRDHFLGVICGNETRMNGKEKGEDMI